MRPSNEYARKAEELMESAGLEDDSECRQYSMAFAQVNATLAQAAAICELIEVLRPQVERERAK